MLATQEYNERLNRWRAQHDVAQRQFIHIGNIRLITGLAAAVLAWLAFGSNLLSGWLLLVPVVVFAGLVVWHVTVIRRRTFAERAIAFYQLGLDRLDDKWHGKGNAGERFRGREHPYAEDLDVFGSGSLFELVASARTKAGEDVLASWLLEPTTHEEAAARQESVRELRERLDLREELALLGEDVRSELDVEATRNWATAPPVTFHPLWRPTAFLLAVLGVVLIIAFFVNLAPLWAVFLVLGLDFTVVFLLRERVSRVIRVFDTAAQSLRLVSVLLQRLEKEWFVSPKLQIASADLKVDGVPASKRIARLGTWMDWLDSSENMFVRVVRPLLLWREQIAMGIEGWRSTNGQLALRWMTRLGEFEALSSFAQLAFERPAWCFPDLVIASRQWRADELRHPLISPATCVPNDVAFHDGLQLMIVSGSNMSGKSTLLRSIGLNTVLAWAGAPTAARHMELSCFQVASSMRVVDSLHDNRSRFYAEITRIRQIFELLKSDRPVLFLLDELLSGTNSHDRLLGATGIVRNLVDSSAIGLITTHDLALAGIEEQLGRRAMNVHFDDRLVDGRIEFDYTLKPGIVTHSNALELMRAVGLQV
jgi:hypothetical protein